MNIRKVLVILAVLLVLPFALKVRAGVVYDSSWTQTSNVDVGTAIDTIAATYLTADVTWDAISDEDLADILWSALPKEQKRDTTTHYVLRIDSTWIIGKIECDTIMTDCWTENDTTRCRKREIPCDTTYRRQLTFVWAPLVTVKLRPEDIEKLKELLNKGYWTTDDTLKMEVK